MSRTTTAWQASSDDDDDPRPVKTMTWNRTVRYQKRCLV
jgi:hypothetical protein